MAATLLSTLPDGILDKIPPSLRTVANISDIIDQIPFNTVSLPTIKTYPINYNPKFYVIGIVFSFITTYFAGWFPARKASKIDPVVIIRGK